MRKEDHEGNGMLHQYLSKLKNIKIQHSYCFQLFNCQKQLKSTLAMVRFNFKW